MEERSDGETDAGDFPPLGGDADGVYETVFREMEDAVFLVDVERTDGDYEFTFRRNNASHRHRTGLSEDELRGKSPQELLGDEQGEAVAANYRRCAEQRETIEYEETLDLPAGTSHWQTKLTPILADGAVTQIVGVGRDVTQRRAQERDLRRTDRRFRTVLETMSAAVFLKDAEGRYLLMNQACRELFDVTDRDVTGLTDDDLFPPGVVEKARADDRRVFEDGETLQIEETVPTADGESVRLTRKSPVYDEEGAVRALCGVSTDISGQKRRERELRRLKERFELAVEGGNLGLWDWDMTTDEVEFNEQYARMLGYERDDVAPYIEEWKRSIHPDDLESVEDALEAHLAGETDYYESDHRTRTAGGDWKWIRAVGQVVERDDGEPVRAVGVHLDIDERKQYERRLERQRDSLEVLNQIVRHDVRNALQRVLAYGDMLRGELDEDGEDKRERLMTAGREIVDITRTAGEVTEVLLRSETDCVPVNVRSVLRKQVDDVRASHERAIVSVDGSVPDVQVMADDMLESVFRNLLSNAVVHNDKQLPEVTVSVEADDAVVRVRIADNGPGVPDSQKEAIFEEGESGVDSEGSGLGLYLVRTLVDRYGGDVWVADNEPEGSVFGVDLRRTR